MKRKLVTVAFALVLVGVVIPLSASAVSVTIQPPSTIIGPGQTFSLDVAITDVSDLFAFNFDLKFDPAILAANGIAEGPFLPSGGPTFFIPGTIDNVSGTVAFTADTLLGAIPGVNGSGTLAAVTFTALELGSGPVTPFGVILLDSALTDIPATVQEGTVNVVPEPATVLLLAGGGVAWGVIRLSARRPKPRTGDNTGEEPNIDETGATPTRARRAVGLTTRTLSPRGR